MGRAEEGGTRPGWKPVMTRAEAEAWCAGSAYPATVLHATSQDAAAAIRREGFNLTYRAAGRIWGNGVYAATDEQTAHYYLRHYGSAGALLELRVNVHRLLRARLLVDSPKRPIHQLLALIPAGLSRFLDAGLREPDEPAALTRLLVEEGYDAVEIVADRFSPAIGGNQLLVFDPRQVVVVTDDDSGAT